MPPLTASSSTGLTITNPLILYRALLATKQIDPDPSQHRLALHLQKLYFRLKDYSPHAEYGSQLRAVSKAVATENEKGNEVAIRGHPLRRNPLFAHLFRRKGNASTLALTKLLTSHEVAMSLDSPKGLLLYGEVGTGKSMLVDLLADSLPNSKKRRWHFNTFMLEILSKLEGLREYRLGSGNLDTEYSLLVVAQEMIEKSPIVFLDEFQLPDRAASKILSNLLTTFFQLGGVMIASSNRMPDELAKYIFPGIFLTSCIGVSHGRRCDRLQSFNALLTLDYHRASGVEYAPPPRTGSLRSRLGLGAGRGRGDIFAGSNEFSTFLGVLKARCEVWDMEGGKDWRRRESDARIPEGDVEFLREEMIESFAGLENAVQGNLGLGYEQSIQNGETALVRDASKFLDREKPSPIMSAVAPKKYIISEVDPEETWQAVVQAALPPGTRSPIPWEPRTLFIYGRTVLVPHQHNGVALWTFADLCGGAFGPADYITFSSTFHTLILTDVPVLTLLHKNEARRLITLLDALYESRCKLIIRASAGPDKLFFPETSTSISTSQSTSPATNTRPAGNERNGTLDADAIYPETLSEIYQDSSAPFRPNVSAYSTQADEDSDFGPLPSGTQPLDFSQTSAFTGEDERFAYKRARSRLWEMCGARWHARSEPGWWRPLPVEERRWERSGSGAGPIGPPKTGVNSGDSGGDVKLGRSVELERMAGLQRKAAEVENSPREKREQPPKIGGWHTWSIVEWGKKAGAWGKDVDGLEEGRQK